MVGNLPQVTWLGRAAVVFDPDLSVPGICGSLAMFYRQYRDCLFVDGATVDCSFPLILRPGELTKGGCPLPLPLFWSGSADPVLGHVAAVYNYLWGVNTWIWISAHSPANTFGWNLGGGRPFSPTTPHSRAGGLENLIFCNRAASIIFLWVIGYLVKLLKLISGPTFLAFNHQCLHVHWWRGWGNIIIFVLSIFLDLFSHLVQTWCCPDLLASSQPSMHVPCVLLGVFGICIVYLALAVAWFISSFPVL